MIDAPVVLAFTAGLVATVNPCGFVMLPAYLSWFVGADGDDEREGVGARLGRALAVSGAVSASFLVVFTAVGLLFSAGALVVVDAIPWVAIVVGVGVVLAGVAMLRGWKPQVALPQPAGGGRHRGAGGAVAFGLSYAVASLSCTLPVFLAVVAGTLTRTDLASGVLAYAAYGAGMSLVLVAVAVAVALARTALVRRLRSVSRRVDRVAAVLLIVAGLYVVAYWVFTIAVPPGSADPPGWASVVGVPLRAVESLSSWSVNAVRVRAGLVTAVLGAVVAAAVITVVGARRRRTGPEDGDETPVTAAGERVGK